MYFYMRLLQTYNHIENERKELLLLYLFLFSLNNLRIDLDEQEL